MAVFNVGGQEYELPDNISEQQTKEILTSLVSQQGQQRQQTGGVISEALGGLETAGAIASGAGAEILGGLGGLVQLGGSTINNLLGFSNEDPAAAAGNTVRGIQNTLTIQPRTPEGKRNLQKLGEFFEPLSDLAQRAEKVSGDIGYNLAGPVAGGLFSAIPAAVMEILPAAQVPRIAGKVIGSKGEKVAQQAEQLKQKIEQPDLAPSLDEAAKTIKKGSMPEIQELIAADPDFYLAADELGISTEPLASFASTNKQFRGIEQGLAAVGGSDLDKQSFEFVQEVANRADKMIETYGGTLDKADLSERFREKSLATIDTLSKRVDELYDELDLKVDETVEVDTDNIVSFLRDQQIKKRGLSPQASKLLKDLEPKQIKTGRFDAVTGQEIINTQKPSYGQLSQRRKEIGQALQKRSGAFSDEETGMLKKMYADLRRDQDVALEANGGLRVQKLADQLVVKRKRLEDNMVKTLGKDLSGSIGAITGRKIKRLSQGNIGEFKKFIERVPEKMRGEVVVTALNDLMRGTGSGQQAFNTNQMAKVTGELNRNKRLKQELFKHLPKGAQNDFDNLGKLAQGIDTALKDKVRTGAVNALLNDESGFLRRMVGNVSGAVLGSKLGIPFGGSAVEQFMKRTPRSEKVGEMLGSQQFQNMIMQAVRDGVVDGKAISDKAKKLEKLVQKSKAYKEWAETLSESEAATLSSIGLISYLIDPDELPE